MYMTPEWPGCAWQALDLAPESNRYFYVIFTYFILIIYLEVCFHLFSPMLWDVQSCVWPQVFASAIGPCRGNHPESGWENV